jgi:CRP-like cAMP-binding protein
MTSDFAESPAKETIAQFLRRTHLFGELDARELKWLSRIVHVRHFADGEFIYEEGRPGAALFLLRRGSVEITKRVADQGVLSIAVLAPPASFEELAALGSDVVRWTSARSKGESELLALGRSDLESLARHAPDIANKVIIRVAEVTARRVRVVLESQGLLSGAVRA